MYVVYSRPYRHAVNNMLIIVNEIALTLISFIQVIFYTNSKTKNIILITGWVMVSLCVTNIFANFTIWIFYNIRLRVIKCKSKGSQNLSNENKASISNNQNIDQAITNNRLDFTTNNSRLRNSSLQSYITAFLLNITSQYYLFCYLKIIKYY